MRIRNLYRADLRSYSYFSVFLSFRPKYKIRRPPLKTCLADPVRWSYAPRLKVLIIFVTVTRKFFPKHPSKHILANYFLRTTRERFQSWFRIHHFKLIAPSLGFSQHDASLIGILVVRFQRIGHRLAHSTGGLSRWRQRRIVGHRFILGIRFLLLLLRLQENYVSGKISTNRKQYNVVVKLEIYDFIFTCLAENISSVSESDDFDFFFTCLFVALPPPFSVFFFAGAATQRIGERKQL